MTEPIHPTNSNPLILFEDLIQNGGIDRCYKKFIAYMNSVYGHFTSEEEIEFTFQAKNDDSKEPFWIEESFSKTLDIEFKDAYEKTIKLIDNHIALFDTSENLKTRIESSLNTIYFLYFGIEKIETYQQTELIDGWINKLIKFIKDKYGFTVPSHMAYDLKDDLKEIDHPTGYFGFKGSDSDLKRLYTVLCDLGLCSKYDKETGERFLDIFAARNLSDLSTGKIITFNCTLQKAAYIFGKIQPLFYNLMDINVINSKCFETKQGKPISQGTFQKARSTYKNNLSLEFERDEIEQKIKKFKITKR